MPKAEGPKPQAVYLWAPVVLYMGALFFVSSLSSIPSPPAGFTDKHEHFFFYGILSVLTVRALAGGRWRGVTIGAAIGAWIIASLYGVSDEFHQRFVPGRDFEILDMVADSCGALAAGMLVWAWGIISGKSTRDAL